MAHILPNSRSVCGALTNDYLTIYNGEWYHSHRLAIAPDWYVDGLAMIYDKLNEFEGQSPNIPIISFRRLTNLGDLNRVLHYPDPPQHLHIRTLPFNSTTY